MTHISNYDFLDELIELNGASAELARLFKQVFPDDYARLLVLAQAFRDHKCFFETFTKADIATLLDNFQPTADRQSDVKRFLEQIVDAHAYVEYVEAEDSADDHGLAAKAVTISHTLTDLINQ